RSDDRGAPDGVRQAVERRDRGRRRSVHRRNRRISADPRTDCSDLDAAPVKILLFGATGMIGQGVLRECLHDPDVTQVVAIGRTATRRRDEKLREIVLPDVGDLSAVEDEVSGFDACFFCLGVSSAGMNEPDYRRLTFDLTLRVARTLAP